MLQSISLKFTELAEPLHFPAQGVTVFVGPNNSGKSLVLREIEQDISSHQKVATKLLNDIEIVWLSDKQLEDDLANLTKKAPIGISPDSVYMGRFHSGGQLDQQTIPHQTLRNFMRGRTEQRWVTSQFLRFFLIRLDGRTRFELTNDRPRGDLLGPAQNMLMHLFQNAVARQRVRDIIFDAFGVYFTIEQLSANDLRIRL
jgi:hypothetical protein